MMEKSKREVPEEGATQIGKSEEKKLEMVVQARERKKMNK